MSTPGITPTPSPTPADPATLARNKEVVRRFLTECVCDGNFDLVSEFVPAEDVETVRARIRMSHSIFGYRHREVGTLVAEGDLVVAYQTIEGTHQGELRNVPATNRPFEVHEFWMARVVDGKIRETWFVPDWMTLLDQVGLTPRLRHPTPEEQAGGQTAWLPPAQRQTA